MHSALSHTPEQTIPIPSGSRQLPAAFSRLLVAAAWVGAIAGGVIALASVPDDRAPASGASAAPAASAGSATGPAEIGRRIPTSFGSMSVDSAARLVGPRSRAGLALGRGDLPLQVGMTFINTSERPIRWSGSLVRLVGASGVPAIRPGGGDTGTIALRPRTARRLILRFAVPAGGAELPRLELREPGASARTSVSLGSVSSLPAFDHVTHSTGPDGRSFHSPGGGR
jgi:hypothetical protein